MKIYKYIFIKSPPYLMVKKKNYTQAANDFKDILASTEGKKPMQKVTPVTKEAQDETQLMVWIPTDLMVKIKTKTVMEKRSMKDIVVQILQEHL
jgi:hypothetical protein